MEKLHPMTGIRRYGWIKLPLKNNLLFGMCLDPGILCHHIFNTLWPSGPHHLKVKKDFFFRKNPKQITYVQPVTLIPDFLRNIFYGISDFLRNQGVFAGSVTGSQQLLLLPGQAGLPNPSYGDSHPFPIFLCSPSPVLSLFQQNQMSAPFFVTTAEPGGSSDSHSHFGISESIGRNWDPVGGKYGTADWDHWEI